MSLNIFGFTAAVCAMTARVAVSILSTALQQGHVTSKLGGFFATAANHTAKRGTHEGSSQFSVLSSQFSVLRRQTSGLRPTGGAPVSASCRLLLRTGFSALQLDRKNVQQVQHFQI